MHFPFPTTDDQKKDQADKIQGWQFLSCPEPLIKKALILHHKKNEVALPLENKCLSPVLEKQL